MNEYTLFDVNSIAAGDMNEHTLFDRAIFVWHWKMVSVSVHCLFYKQMDEKIKI